jgi:hypothetical protein
MLKSQRVHVPHQFEIRDAASAFVQQLLPDNHADRQLRGLCRNRVVIKPSGFSSSKGELLTRGRRSASDAGPRSSSRSTRALPPSPTAAAGAWCHLQRWATMPRRA